MAVSVTVDQILGNLDSTTKEQCVYLTLTLTGNYGGASSNGDTLNLAGLGSYGVQSSRVPIHLDLDEQPPAGTAPTGYTFVYQPGLTPATCGLAIMSTAGTQYTQGSAYSAALLGATIKARAWYPLGT